MEKVQIKPPKDLMQLYCTLQILYIVKLQWKLGHL